MIGCQLSTKDARRSLGNNPLQGTQYKAIVLACETMGGEKRDNTYVNAGAGKGELGEVTDQSEMLGCEEEK